jgi:hypothetical protein
MAANVKDMVVAELDDVPPALLPEVLRFVRFLKMQSRDVGLEDLSKLRQELVTVPAKQVLALSGLADLSGDAFSDTEQLYAE